MTTENTVSDGPICLHDIDDPMAWVTTSNGTNPAPRQGVHALEIAAVWQGSILSVEHLAPGQDYVLGGPKLPLEAKVLPEERFALFAWDDKEAVCRFMPTWKGTLRSEELSQGFDDLVEQGTALEDEDEVHQFLLEPGQQVIVDVGPVTFVARLVTPGKKVAPHTDGVDAPFVGITSFAAFLAAAFGYVAATAPPASALQVNELPDRFVELALELPTPEPEFKVPVKKQAADRAGEKARRDEGKVGKKDALMERARGSKVAKALHDREVVKDAGVFGAMSDSGMDAIFGTSGLNQDIVGGIGGIIGSKGTQFGSGGLSSRGGGLGGGGEAEGIGGLGTHGRNSGEHDYGEGELGPRSSDPGIASIGGGEIVVGALDASLIDGVIKRNLPRFRYCYQRELTKDPNLSGKTTVKFTIIGDGTVSAAVTKSSSVSNSNVESCLNRVMMGLQFPEPRGGGIVLVSYPFVFSPG